MNFLATLFVLLNVGILFSVPRRWAPMPLIAGACYMTLAQGIDIGPLSFTVVRILILAGIARAVIKGERLVGGLRSFDWVMVAFGGWAVFSSVFHQPGPDGNPLVFRLGLALNTCGIYFLIRVFCQSTDDLIHLIKITAILLVPVALEMACEKIIGRNFFSVLGGVSPFPPIREGRLRAQGPFTSSILAGTVGAVCFPLIVALWNRDRRTAMLGGGACLLMVFASASSGPVLSLMAGIFALVMWKFRAWTRMARIGAVVAYFVLDLVMAPPAYYLLGRIDISGGSTGWHRAQLINVAFGHLHEWWLGGTDYTKHWMSTGVTWSPNHVDITNYYIKMGVWGGLPLMFLLLTLYYKGFSAIGREVRELEYEGSGRGFLVWAVGSALFAHAATGIAVSYSDQSFLFLYLTFAVAAVFPAARAVGIPTEQREEHHDFDQVSERGDPIEVESGPGQDYKPRSGFNQ